MPSPNLREQTRAYHQLIRPEPETRSLVLGSTGSGKSTLNAVLLELYRERHPSHLIVILDPKKRFFATRGKAGTSLFPDGYAAVPHGRRRGVTVTGRLIEGADGFSFRNETVYVIQDLGKAVEFAEWAYAKGADIKRPILVYVDEIMDLLMGNGRLYLSFRRLMAQGRELAIGMLVTSQRLVWADSQLISEVERIYVGMLHARNDRKKLVDNVHLVSPAAVLALAKPIPWHQFDLIDQVKGQHRLFTLELQRT